MPLFPEAPPRRLLEIYRRNGLERLAKTAVRHALFDRPARAELEAALRRRGGALRPAPERLLVGDAAALELEPASLDLVYSVGVFEHVPAPALERLCERMASWLRPGGLALVRVGVFTGVLGGHLPEWQDVAAHPGRPRRSEPWDHLRARRFRPDTLLNELRRDDYRRLFGARFELLEELDAQPGLGRELLTPELRAELAGYSEEDLLSNQVLFVLRRP